ncbi:MAG TPA: hypothetical protein VMH00_10725 [Candidatus Limnocylindrales bacterium]|nr:hypothetical protein [Candidatus Limnocylindrales bacterium]
MKKSSREIAPLLCLFLLVAWSLSAQTASKVNNKPCLTFAQDFYNWYVANVFENFKATNPEMPWREAMKYKGDPFSTELSRALIESEAEAKAEGDPVLDFDPILGTQDPADRYVVRSVSKKNGHCWAQVYGVWSRDASGPGKQPQVIAELALTDGRWVFVNFHYPISTSPESENLLSILRHRYHH